MKSSSVINSILLGLTAMAVSVSVFAENKILSASKAHQFDKMKQLQLGGGESAGGGGTDVGIEFSTVLESIVKKLEKDSELKKRFPEFTIDQIKSTLQAKVLPRPQIQLSKSVIFENKAIVKSVDVVAANYPGSSPVDWTIEVSESLWPTLKENECKRQILVLHEALGLLRLERDSYSISSRLCKPYGGDFINIPSSPRTAGSWGSPTMLVSNNSDFVRSEFHIPKSAATREQALREVEVHKKTGALISTLVESETEWIVLVIYSVLK